MSILLELRENLRNFYSKNEVFITPIFKFLLALISCLLINGNLGYMSKLNNPLIPLIVALMCSFLPYNFIVMISAIFVVAHMYALSMEAAIVTIGVFVLLFLLYFRFSPKDTLVVLLLPVCFALNIPFVVVVFAGLLCSLTSVISVSCGVIVYYLIIYIKMNATAITNLEVENAIGKFRYIIDGMFANKEMLIDIIAFAITVILVYLIRRLSTDHAWTIAMIVGLLTSTVIILLGDLMLDTNTSIIGIIIGAIISFLLCKVLQFFVFNVDYTRTEYVQFEDDEYYYYVKAVPKNSVPKTKRTVKKITSVIDYKE